MRPPDLEGDDCYDERIAGESTVDALGAVERSIYLRGNDGKRKS